MNRGAHFRSEELQLLRGILVDKTRTHANVNENSTREYDELDHSICSYPKRVKVHNLMKECIKVAAMKLRLSEHFIHTILPTEVLSVELTPNAGFINTYLNLMKNLEKAIEVCNLKWPEKHVIANYMNSALREIEQVLNSSNLESNFPSNNPILSAFTN